MNRRGFLGALLALPLLGCVKKADAVIPMACLHYRGYSSDNFNLAEFRRLKHLPVSIPEGMVLNIEPGHTYHAGGKK